jgi:ribose 5-phosphate isomerase A
MIKGGGGALLREKVVAYSSTRVAIVVGRAKLVARLGTTFRLPVEVIPFARSVVERAILAAGAVPELRGGAEAKPYLTDNGNEILDCRFPEGIADPVALETALDRIPASSRRASSSASAHVLVIGDEDGTCEVREKPREDRLKAELQTGSGL